MYTTTAELEKGIFTNKRKKKAAAVHVANADKSFIQNGHSRAIVYLCVLYSGCV